MDLQFMRCGNERERKIVIICYRKKQMDVSFSCVCPVIDHEFCHNIVKVAVDPRGDSRVDPQTALTMI